MTETAPRQPSVFDRAFLTDAEEVDELLLIRHAQQAIDPEGAVGELLDPPLSDQGEQQARLVGIGLSTTKLDAIICSPLRRARQTAEAIAAHHDGLDPTVMDDLREIELFRDVPADQKLRDYFGIPLLKAVRTRMLQERSWDVYPYSESSFDFRKRVINAIESIVATYDSSRVAVVCHGGVINAYVSHVAKSPLDMMFRPGHTSISSVLAGDGRRVLNTLNDMTHLRTAEGHFHSY
jgi:broad specificity phosphatase PhoE